MQHTLESFHTLFSDEKNNEGVARAMFQQLPFLNSFLILTPPLIWCNL